MSYDVLMNKGCHNFLGYEVGYNCYNIGNCYYCCCSTFVVVGNIVVVVAADVTVVALHICLAIH